MKVKPSSPPRKQGSALLEELDSRLRGNDVVLEAEQESMAEEKD